MMHSTSKGPRAEHRLRERERIADSPTLQKRFPALKSLTVNLQFFDSPAALKSTEMKYKVNLEHAKSVFLFACPSTECVSGDFDLTKLLASAVKARRKLATGELFCHGQRKKASKELVPCRSILRYTLNLAYGRR